MNNNFINLDLADKDIINCQTNFKSTKFKIEINYVLYPPEEYPKSKYKIEVTDYYADNFDFEKKCCNTYIRVSITKLSKKENKTKTLLIDLGEFHDFLGLYEENTKHYIDHLYVQGEDIIHHFDCMIMNQIQEVFNKKYSK